MAAPNSTVVREVRLIFSETRTNNNKFWTGILYADGTVHTEWGRVGMSAQSKTFPHGGDSYLSSKEREKLAKGYTPLKTVAANSTVTATVSSQSTLAKLVKEQIQVDNSSPELAKLIKLLVDANIHQITKATQIKFDASSGLFTTPLGIVTSDGIDEGRRLLDTISLNLGQNNDAFLDAVSAYFRIVPQNIGMRKFVAADIFPNAKAVQQQSDILDSLEASYDALQKGKVTASGQPAAIKQEKVFSVKLTLADAAEFARVERKYRETRQDRHVCAHLKVKRVFCVVIEDMANGFASVGAPLGGVQELWHGTKKANLLSILKSGLRVSPPSTARIAGKMFGNGIYFAPASTKSLNYAYGYWDGSRDENCFMFLAQVALGKSYVPKSSGDSPFPRKGYDSVWAKAHVSGVHNDEIIVYQNGQCNLTHLVEFDR